MKQFLRNWLLKISRNVTVGRDVKIMPFTNLYGCTLEDDVFVGPFVEIQQGVTIRKRTRISSHTFIPSGVYIGEDCFIGHGVMFVNDKFTEERDDWKLRTTIIGDGVRIGSNATILPVVIGHGVVIGAGAVVTKPVLSYTVVKGNPAK